MKLLVIFVAFLLFSSPANAHPGRTAADGCHYCRTNCAKWGEVEDARHCHGGAVETSAPVVKYVAPELTQEPKKVEIPSPIPSPKAQVIASPIPTPSPSLAPEISPSPTPVEEAESSSSAVLGDNTQEEKSQESGDDGSNEVLGLGVLLAGGGYLGYRHLKAKKKLEPTQDN